MGSQGRAWAENRVGPSLEEWMNSPGRSPSPLTATATIPSSLSPIETDNSTSRSHYGNLHKLHCAKYEHTGDQTAIQNGVAAEHLKTGS